MEEIEETVVIKKDYRFLIIGLILLGLLQMGDLLTTLHLVGIAGNEVEQNPLAAFFLDRGWLEEMKVAVVMCAFTAFWVFRNKIRSTQFVWIGVAFYTCVVGWNLSQIVLA